jgi:hypothetical protein
MNIFIKFNEKRISITIKNNNISIFELIEQIKNEIFIFNFKNIFLILKIFIPG